MSDNRPSQVYAQSLYSRINVEIDYFYLSAYFPTAKSSNAESGENETTPISDTPNDEEEVDAEHSTSNNSSGEIQEERIEEEEKWKEVVFPRLYSGSLSSFNKLIPYLSTFTDITNNISQPTTITTTTTTTTTLEMVFADVDNKMDYRCVLVMTGVSGCTSDIPQRYRCGEETTRGKLGKCMKDRLFCQADTSLLKEDDGCGSGNSSVSLHARAWGKGKKSMSGGSGMSGGSENGVLKLADCMELKKTTTVMLGNKR